MLKHQHGFQSPYVLGMDKYFFLCKWVGLHPIQYFQIINQRNATIWDVDFQSVCHIFKVNNLLLFYRYLSSDCSEEIGNHHPAVHNSWSLICKISPVQCRNLTENSDFNINSRNEFDCSSHKSIE